MAVLLVGSAAGHATFAQDDTADGSVRFLHASPDAPEVDILVDGLPLGQGIAFGTATEYAPLTPGSHEIKVVPAGQDASAAVLEDSIDVDSDQAYTVAIANRLNDLEIKVYQSNIDDLDNPQQSRVRAINLVPDAGEVDIYQTGGDQWFDNVDFGDASDHRDVDSGPYDLEVRPNDSDQVMTTVEGLQIDSGQEYSLYLLGLNEDSSVSVLPLTISVVTPCGETLGVESQIDDACLQFVHASADSGAVDVYLEDTLIAQGLEAGTYTEFEAFPNGDSRSLKVVSAGGSADDPLVDTSIDLNTGTAYQVVLGGNADDLKLETISLDLSPLPESQSRLTLTHLSPDADNVDVIITDGDTLFEDVGFEDTTDPIVVDSGTYDIQVKKSGEDTVYLRTTDFTVDAGFAYSLIAYGNTGDGSFTVLVIEAPVTVRSGAVGDVNASGTPGVETSDASVVGEGTPEPVASAEVEATPTS
jgi:Domain of unknown function (DUF4397)